MTAGMFGYVTNDAFIKRAAEDLPLFQSIFLRGLVVVVLLNVIVRARGAAVPFRNYLERPLLLRMSMEVAGTIIYLISLQHVPIAGMTAVLQLLPIAVTFAAARMLRERVSMHRVIALVMGFVGVLFVVQPGGDDFTPWFLGGLITVVVLVVREISTRQISASMPGSAVALGTGTVIATMGGIVTIFTGWERPNGLTLALLASGACFLSLGYVASIHSVRLGDLSFTATFRYTILIFAIALQIIVFGEIPDAMTFIGSAIVTVAGLYALANESKAPTPSELR